MILSNSDREPLPRRRKVSLQGEVPPSGKAVSEGVGSDGSGFDLEDEKLIRAFVKDARDHVVEVRPKDGIVSMKLFCEGFDEEKRPQAEVDIQRTIDLFGKEYGLVLFSGKEGLMLRLLEDDEGKEEFLGRTRAFILRHRPEDRIFDVRSFCQEVDKFNRPLTVKKIIASVEEFGLQFGLSVCQAQWGAALKVDGAPLSAPPALASSSGTGDSSSSNYKARVLLRPRVDPVLVPSAAVTSSSPRTVPKRKRVVGSRDSGLLDDFHGEDEHFWPPRAPEPFGSGSGDRKRVRRP